MPRILFVSGFHPSTRARDLAYEFERFGPLVRCDVPAPRNPHAHSNSYAFVEFRGQRDAEDAYYDMHGRVFEGSRLSIQWARSPPSAVWRFDQHSAPSNGGGGRSRDRERSRSPRRRDEREKTRDDRGDRDRDRHRRSRSPERKRSLSPERYREREDRGRNDREKDRARTPPPPNGIEVRRDEDRARTPPFVGRE